jgi:hypothetical protein
MDAFEFLKNLMLIMISNDSGVGTR